MARKNQVTLSFAGDSSQLESAFDQVGSSAQEMRGDVNKASGSVDKMGSGFDAAGGKVEASEQKIRGFRDIIDGTGDVARGFAEGDLSLMTKGFADIAGGASALVLPAMKKIATGALNMGKRVGTAATSFVVSSARMTASMARTVAVTVAGWVTMGAQALANAARMAAAWLIAMGPIAVIIAAVVGLAALIIANWDTIREATVKVFTAIMDWFSGVWDTITGLFTSAGENVSAVWEGVMSFFTGLPDKIGSAFGAIFDIVTAPFRSAFNFVADAWNNTVGQLSWDVPGWVPGIGGNSVGAPKLPKFHEGGTVGGAPGTETLALLEAGETVIPRSESPAVVQLVVRSGGERLDDLLVEMLSRAVRVRGGNAQLVLGG